MEKKPNNKNKQELPDWQKTLELVKQYPVTENMFPKRDKSPGWKSVR